VRKLKRVAAHVHVKAEPPVQAEVGDIFMGVIQTCVANDGNPFDSMLAGGPPREGGQRTLGRVAAVEQQRKEALASADRPKEPPPPYPPPPGPRDFPPPHACRRHTLQLRRDIGQQHSSGNESMRLSLLAVRISEVS
jgi:hypothetical protein